MCTKVIERNHPNCLTKVRKHSGWKHSSNRTSSCSRPRSTWLLFSIAPRPCKSWRCVLVQTGHVTCYTGAGLGQTYTACLNYFNIDCLWVTMWHTTDFSACSSCKVFRFRGGKCLSFKVTQKVKYSVLSCACWTRGSMKTQSTFQFLPSFLFFSFFFSP